MQDILMQDILNAFRVISDRAFSCAGVVVETRGDSLLAGLQDCLYRLCYARRFRGAFLPEDATPDADEELLRKLQAANAARTIHEPGWRIAQIDESGKILASRDGVTRWFLPGHYLADKGPGFAVKEGGLVSIYTPRDSTTEQSAFYLAFGETTSHEEEHVDLLRFYWNVVAAGAPRLMSLLTRELNRFQVPYMFKCANHPAIYERSDAAVLYVNRRYYGITARIVAAIYPRVANVLEPDTPLFTRPLADGLGFAENPVDGGSFGASRCAVVAATLQACYEKKLETIEARLAELDAQFRDHGIDPRRPYLNLASRDYEGLPE